MWSAPPSCSAHRISREIFTEVRPSICVFFTFTTRSFRVCNRESVVNRVKLRADTLHDTFHPLKRKRFARTREGLSWLNQKQDWQKAHFTQFTTVPVANCLPITLRQTTPFLEADSFKYQFYRPCLPEYHRSPCIATDRWLALPLTAPVNLCFL